MTPEENQAIREETQTWIMGSVLDADNARPRSQQQHLGPSELGHCREYVRAKVAGDPQENLPNVKWAAFIGTAVGEFVEAAVAAHGGARTQVAVSYTLPRLGFVIAGSADIVGPRGVYDLKSKDGIDGVMREGASRKELTQISVYLLGLVASGELSEDALGTLVYYDRSGKDKQVYTVSVTTTEARGWIEVAEERLDDVVKALANPAYGDGERHLRDEAESTCWYFGCPFYVQCWAGYVPEEKITDTRLNAALQQYDDGRELAKTAKKIQDAAKATLGVGEETPVVGLGTDFSIDWKLNERFGVLVRQIDVRKRR